MTSSSRTGLGHARGILVGSIWKSPLQFFDHPARDFPLAHDDHIRPQPLQMFDLGVRMRARDDPDMGVGGARLLDDLSRLEGLRNGNDDVSAFGQSRGLEN